MSYVLKKNYVAWRNTGWTDALVDTIQTSIAYLDKKFRINLFKKFSELEHMDN